MSVKEIVLTTDVLTKTDCETIKKQIKKEALESINHLLEETVFDAMQEACNTMIKEVVKEGRAEFKALLKKQVLEDLRGARFHWEMEY